MFAEWVTTGMAIGIKAFFAALVFVLCSGIALMLFGLIANFFGGGDEDDMDRD